MSMFYEHTTFEGLSRSTKSRVGTLNEVAQLN